MQGGRQSCGEGTAGTEKGGLPTNDPDIVQCTSAQNQGEDATNQGTYNERKGHGDVPNNTLKNVDVTALESNDISSEEPTGQCQVADPPPDGGLMAWSMCICAHVLIANTWGIMNSFGVFQAYYTDYLKITPSEISWIGAIQNFLGYFLSTLSGRLSDAGHFRLSLSIGTGLLILGSFTMSFSTKYWQLMLTQGVTMGLAAGFLCCPMMSVTGTYFSKNRSLVLGIITCGNVTGGLIYPAMARQLLPAVGFGWALRAIAFIQAATMIAVTFIARARVKPNTTGPMLELSAFKEPEFSFYTFGMFFGFSGTYIALYYMPQFSRAIINPPLSYPDSLNLLLIFNGVSLFGRIIPSRLADKLGPVNTIIPAVLGGGIMCLGWIGVTSPAGMYAWTTVYALVGGALLALFPGGLMSLTDDLSKAGTRMGMAFSVEGFAVLVGPPVAGAIIQNSGGRYVGAQAFAGALLVVGGVLVFGAKAARMRRTGQGWTARI